MAEAMTTTWQTFGGAENRLTLWRLQPDTDQIETIPLGVDGWMEFAAWLQIEGHASIQNGGKPVELDAGDIAIIRFSGPVSTQTASSAASSLLMMVSTLVSRSFAPPETGFVLKIERSALIGQLISNFMRHAAAALPDADRRTTNRLIQALEQLLDVAIDTIAPPGDLSMPRGGDPFSAATAYIETQLENSALGLATVAEAVCVPARTLQKIFKEHGTTLNECIWSHRLKRAHQRLGDPMFDSHTVQQIAFSCGFLNIAHFNRRFKAAFGAPPRTFRKGQR